MGALFAWSASLGMGSGFSDRWRRSASLVWESMPPDLPDEQQSSRLRGIEQALEQDEDLERPDVDVRVDGMLIETVRRQTRLDFGRGNRIEPPTQRILTCVVLGLVLELRRNPGHVDTA